MKNIWFYLIMLGLFILILFSIAGALGTMVSKKYQVDEALIFTSDEASLSPEEAAEIRRIENLNTSLNRQLIVYVSLGILSVLSMATLIFTRIRRVLREMRTSEAETSKKEQ